MSNIKTFIIENVNLKSDDATFVFNIEDVLKKHQKWLELMPMVMPYYAVKANRLPLLLDIMIGLGLRFDCASLFEMKEILKRGGKARDIIFAHPCKPDTFLEYAKRNKVDLMTFDNEEELIKIEAIFPSARLVLRIKVDDKDSVVRLNSKFGAYLQDVEKLLVRAKGLKLNVMGIAFHVGSMSKSTQAYVDAIHNSRVAFDMAMGMGFPISLLDIGGGYPGKDNSLENIPTFEQFAEVINKTLNQYYPEQYLKIIGEPGRYYTESAFTLYTKVISKSVIDLNGEKTVMYYLNDGTYGSFPYAVRGKKIYKPVPFLQNIDQVNSRSIYPTILWGPTCDSGDCIRTDFKMPEMFVREWILFENMGTYSQTYSEFGFNGMPSPTIKVFVSEWAQTTLRKYRIWHKIKLHLVNIHRNADEELNAVE